MMVKAAMLLLVVALGALLEETSAQLAPWDTTEACYVDAGWE